SILLVFRDPSTNQIQYRRSSDGARWSAPAPVPGIRAGPARPYDLYDMATDSAGHLQLVLAAYPAGSNTLSLLQTEWDGRGWTGLSLISSSPSPSEYPKLAISEGDRLHVVWFVSDPDKADWTPTGVWYSTTLLASPRLARSPENTAESGQA